MGFASPELHDTLEVAAGSEIHGTSKIAIVGDYVEKMKLTPKIRIKLKVLLCALNRGIVQADHGCSKNIKHEDYVSCISTHQEVNLSTHQRLIDILHPTEQTLESLM
ncbi:hypothetical protein MKW92_032682 [Papaver armeniacum]|nr:hypothetical protein MKW92_032682 [Papaver armeniacum]